MRLYLCKKKKTYTLVKSGFYYFYNSTYIRHKYLWCATYLSFQCFYINFR